MESPISPLTFTPIYVVADDSAAAHKGGWFNKACWKVMIEDCEQKIDVLHFDPVEPEVLADLVEQLNAMIGQKYPAARMYPDQSKDMRLNLVDAARNSRENAYKKSFTTYVSS